MLSLKKLFLILSNCGVILTASLGSVVIDSYSEDIYKAHYIRKLINNELVFVIMKDSGTGSGFIAEIKGSPYFVTNYHVLESILKSDPFGKNKGYYFENEYGRKLLVSSPVYYKLEADIYEYKGVGQYNGDLVLIPMNEDYLSVKPLKLSTKKATKGDTLYVLGNTKGQGFIDSKEGILVGEDENYFELYSGARQGNSGGPILNSMNEVCGIFTLTAKDVKIDKNYGLRFNEKLVNYWIDSGMFVQRSFSSDIINWYTNDLLLNYKPGHHSSRVGNKKNPHLSIGIPLGENLSVADMFRAREYRRSAIKCYNWDLIPRERLLKLCHRYGQTVYEFIPDSWVTFEENSYVKEAFEERSNCLFEINNFYEIFNEMKKLPSRSEKLDYSIENNILMPLRAFFNGNNKLQKMESNGEVVSIEEYIENNYNL